MIPCLGKGLKVLGHHLTSRSYKREFGLSVDSVVELSLYLFYCPSQHSDENVDLNYLDVCVLTKALLARRTVKIIVRIECFFDPRRPRVAVFLFCVG